MLASFTPTNEKSMRRMSRSCLLPVLFALGGLMAAGCGGGGAKPTGQLLSNGQSYKLADGEAASITFSSLEPGKTAASATAAQDGSFAVQGQGLQPGSYVVSVISNNMKGSAAEKYNDKFKSAFIGASSPLRIDIGSESAPSIVIDLDAKTATKK
jgi:hypothetical protein